jgi:hypothetical protein
VTEIFLVGELVSREIRRNHRQKGKTIFLVKIFVPL